MGGITYFPAYFSYLETLEDLNDEQVGKVFRAALKYASTGEISELESAEKVAFKFIKREIDESKDKYKKMRSANAQNGLKGGRPAKAADAEEKPSVSEKSDRFSEKPKETDRFSEKPKKAIENEKEKEKENNTVSNDTVYAPDGATSIRKPRNMIPPDPEAVRLFIAEHGLKVDADAFIDYYAAQGWKLSNGIMMKDWQAALRKWSRNEASPRAAPAGTGDRDPMLAYLDKVINGEIDVPDTFGMGGESNDEGRDGGDNQGPADGLSEFLFPLQSG